MPMSSTFLRPMRSEMLPLSQAEMAHASDVPDTSSPACQNSRQQSYAPQPLEDANDPQGLRQRASQRALVLGLTVAAGGAGR